MVRHRFGGGPMKSSRLWQLPITRRRILTALKQRGPITIADLADDIGISGEAVRQQLIQIQRDGWVKSFVERKNRTGRSGRPATRYMLTEPGEEIFPKRYDVLARSLMGAMTRSLSKDETGRVLVRMVEDNVQRWEPRLEPLSFDEKVQALKDVYVEGDGFTDAGKDENGSFIVQQNCPFLNAALERPEICAVTTNTLSRLLGRQVVREDRFQAGDGRCCFRILADPPRDDGKFRPEPAPGSGPLDGIIAPPSPNGR